ncbi:DUF2244 domain-containing protein [Psychromarinibacter halotolerans]|uniref:DUF2244 domain-containing protein n=1 Tax=Psychromarinibacter halotolerans TaxID=1775175 RepID=A0ABV7GUI1_9RHOB|nr:DUF2244 domain-containing protein [Psychromarinibacter halotolerans]MDF0595086.1 DUF2244 domain-containing protein [Psychromarinibacter halotolerans]
MPYRWTHAPTGPDTATSPDPAPVCTLELWPHRSLSPEGFVTFFGITFLMVLVPLFSVIGSPVLWGLLPFVMGALALTWTLMRRNSRDAVERTETLALWPERITLIRRDIGKPDRTWEANPYWIRVEIHEDNGPVENYLTLTGAGRTVELGAFLSPDERATLHRELQDRLARLGQPSQ